MERLEATLAAGGGYFGLCPECGGEDGYMNVGPCHWDVCDEHRVKWCIGSNVFSSWEDEPEVLHRENAEKLAFYREVEPYRHPDPEWNIPPEESDDDSPHGSTIPF